MGDDEFHNKKPKAHKPPQAGKKAEKKKKKGTHSQELTAQQKNPKAFTFKSARKAGNAIRRTADIQAKKTHVPEVDRTPVELPPVVVAIVGPPMVGKTTLLKCLISNYTRQSISKSLGPITIVSGKKQRLTFIECNNDMNSMIDVAKVADLALLLVDATFGFEMETFEFLNICQAHGFPRIMGVLTHLDSYKNTKALRKRKKLLKHRFWTEIYPGAKLFYLSGMVHGEYNYREVHNLSRFISVMKYRPLQWRSQHPYVIVDRIEDMTSPEEIRQKPKCDRKLCLYGYLRGTFLKCDSKAHIPGCGDISISDISYLADPCPLPDKKKKRSLNDKERLIFAPMAGVGGIMYDKDAVYINLAGSHSHKSKDNTEDDGSEVEEEETGLVSTIMDTQQTIDEKMEESTLQIFSQSAPLTAGDVDDMQMEEEESARMDTDEPPTKKPKKSDYKFADSDDELEKDLADLRNVQCDDAETSDEDVTTDVNSSVPRRTSVIRNTDTSVHEKISETLAQLTDAAQDEDSEDSDDELVDSDEEMISEDDEDSAVKWKTDLTKKAADDFYKRQHDTTNLRKLVYGIVEEKEDSEGEDEIGGLFKVMKATKDDKDGVRGRRDGLDCSIFTCDNMHDWGDTEVRESIKDCFVTGKWAAARDAENLLNMDEEGDFEDLEAAEDEEKGDEENTEEAPATATYNRNKTDVEGGDKKTKAEKAEARAEKKRKLKAMFDQDYDEKESSGFYDDLKKEVELQTELNRSEFAGLDDELRIQYEGYRPGMYVRLEVERAPCELINHFDPQYPLIVGGVSKEEERVGYVQVRIKKHRWHKKILKTRDPIIVSMGWRRFQTMPLYYIEDHNKRQRMLKYTPEHLHCLAQFWGPITTQGTGILAVQSVSDRQPGFRISATGSVLSIDKSANIVKKLKLTGTPFRIHHKTAFIQGMFSSHLEAAKFTGAQIKAVSGLRGQLKKPIKTPPGAFRATFEDKILMTDIVFIRTWYGVTVPKFYNTVTSLLLPPEQKNSWKGMKTVGQLKRERAIQSQVNTDHLYTDIERVTPIFPPLVVPKSLQQSLPYADKPKYAPSKTKPSLDSQRISVIREPHEQKVASMMSMLRSLNEHKIETQKQRMAERVMQYKERKATQDQAVLKRQKEVRRRIHRAVSKMNGERKTHKKPTE